MKQLSILGCTGSIGCQTLEVCRWFPERLQVSVLAAGSNVQLLAEQVREFRPQLVALADADKYPQLREALGGLPVEIALGHEAMVQAALWPTADTVVAAIAGIAGLPAAWAAVAAGKQVALANKEVLVSAGELVTALARAHNAAIVPVDSEHSAIYQCLVGEAAPTQLLITASGGPFRCLSADELAQVTAEQALQHPTWSMGAKVTVDSASLANKGLEVIEAHHLFGLDYADIEVLVHPQSIVHSLVRFADGSIKAQLASADMRLPIQYALLGPERDANPAPPVDLAEVACLQFSRPDVARFPALRVAYQAGKQGGSYPTAFNAANEVLGAAFLQGQIAFPLIGQGLEAILDGHQNQQMLGLDDVLAVDAAVKRQTKEYLRQQGLK